MPKPLWVKGQSGNPNGRPLKGKSLADDLNAAFDEKLEDGRSVRKAAIDRLKAIILDGSDKDAISAINLAWDRMYGKALDHIALSHDDEEQPSIQELQDLIVLRREQDGQEDSSA